MLLERESWRTSMSDTERVTNAIRRFLRPVSFQNIPAALLPDDLQ